MCNPKISQRMESSPKYPVGIQSFEKIRTSGMLYVDKTALIYKLTHTFESVFLSRPRRFGKTLLTRTVQAYSFRIPDRHLHLFTAGHVQRAEQLENHHRTR
jgi:hypothetical protein